LRGLGRHNEVYCDFQVDLILSLSKDEVVASIAEPSPAPTVSLEYIEREMD
jgi:hypothetical protein